MSKDLSLLKDEFVGKLVAIHMQKRSESGKGIVLEGDVSAQGEKYPFKAVFEPKNGVGQVTPFATGVSLIFRKRKSPSTVFTAAIARPDNTVAYGVRL